MLFGWLGFLLSGVFAARYLRNLWPNTTVSGLRIWFHVSAQPLRGARSHL